MKTINISTHNIFKTRLVKYVTYFLGHTLYSSMYFYIDSTSQFKLARLQGLHNYP